MNLIKTAVSRPDCSVTHPTPTASPHPPACDGGAGYTSSSHTMCSRSSSFLLLPPPGSQPLGSFSSAPLVPRMALEGEKREERGAWPKPELGLPILNCMSKACGLSDPAGSGSVPTTRVGNLRVSSQLARTEKQKRSSGGPRLRVAATPSRWVALWAGERRQNPGKAAAPAATPEVEGCPARERRRQWRLAAVGPARPALSRASEAVWLERCSGTAWALSTRRTTPST